MRARATAATLVASVAALFALGTPVAQAEKGKTKKIDLSKPFSHGSHFKEMTPKGDRLLMCDDCHRLEGDGEDKASYPICSSPRMPFPSHDRCTVCHQTAFFTRPLQICSNCHTTNKFQSKPPLKEQNASKNAPLKPRFNHRLHMDDRSRVSKRFKMKRDCSFCHTFSNGGEKVNLPGHPQCCECHTKKNVEPNINNCSGCHARPKNERLKPSLIKKFSHADHSMDPANGQTLPCMRCHSAVPKATKVKTIDMPVMATCVPCHNGKLAPDYANCLMCHGKDITQQPVPESHKK